MINLYKKLIFLFIGLAAFSATKAQTAETADSVSVNGVCSMCKKNIEKSALDAGATFAFWDKKTKVLQVKFEPGKTNMQKIEQKIADKGYDTQNIKASDEAYNKLELCCQYERKPLKPVKQ